MKKRLLKPVLLHGMKDGSFTRIIGIIDNAEFKVKYEPNSYIEFLNKPMGKIKSFYDYQLKKRLKQFINA